MLGKLWSQPYTNNPFPYLSDNFHKLSKEDQQLVTEIYNNHYSKYKQAVDKFYELRLTSTQP